MITGMNHVTLAVTNLDRSFQFYREVVGLKPLCRWHQGAYFLVGSSESEPEQGFWFCLNVDTKHTANPCYTHYAFSVSPENFDLMSKRIISSGAPIFKANTSPGSSLYFLDPDQHKLEIHACNWQARVEAKKQDPGLWTDVEWFI